MSTYFSYLSVAIGLFLLVAMIRFFFRKKYVEDFRKLPHATKDKLIKSDKQIMRLFKMFLWLAPLYLGVFPLVIFVYFPEALLSTILCMWLLFIAVLQEYGFRKWLSQNLLHV